MCGPPKRYKMTFFPNAATHLNPRKFMRSKITVYVQNARLLQQGQGNAGTHFSGH